MKDHVFLFPGQGSQVVGMGKDLYLNTALGKKTFDMANEILGYHFSKICFEGPEEELRLTYNGQPALLTVSYILYNLLGEVPYMAAGHSLGEYSALLCAGAIKYEDAVLAVHKRGKYMQEAVPVGKGAMAAIMGVDVEKIFEVVEKVEGIVDVANLNSPTQVVISGEKQSVQEAVAIIAPRKVKYLPVSAPFHSELMRPAEEKLTADLNNIEFKDLAFPVINNIEAAEVTTGEYARYSLKKQVSRPVLWHNTIMRFLKEKEIKKFTEMGSGRVLTGLLKRTARQEGFNIETYNIRNLEDLRTICKN